MRVEGDRVVDLCAAPPLAGKVRHGVNGPELTIVGSAASLLEGDVVRIELTLGRGARLTVTTAAAQLAHPCLGGGQTALHVHAALGDDAQLDWRPEPTVVCAGGDHVAATTVVLGTAAVARWLDELVLGRSGEPPDAARVTTTLLVDGPDGPVLRDGLDTRLPGAHGPAVLGRAARYVGAQHVWGVRPLGATPEGVTRFDLAAPGACWRAVTADVASGRAAIAAVTG